MYSIVPSNPSSEILLSTTAHIGTPSSNQVNNLESLISSDLASISSTSQFAQTNLLFRNLASGDASQTQT